jgi:hypothetical protein
MEEYDSNEPERFCCPKCETDVCPFCGECQNIDKCSLAKCDITKRCKSTPSWV